VLRAKEIKAGRVSARGIYAKEVKARDGQVGRIYRVEGNEDWGGNEIRVPEISADVIYAKEIHADWVEASEIHAGAEEGGGHRHRPDRQQDGHPSRYRQLRIAQCARANVRTRAANLLPKVTAQP
jgi:hypothetical protein